MNCMRLPVTGGNTWIILAIAGACLASGVLLTYRTRKLSPVVAVVILLGAVGLIAHPRAADAAGAPCLPTTTTIAGSGIPTAPTTVPTSTLPATTIPAVVSTVEATTSTAASTTTTAQLPAQIRGRVTRFGWIDGDNTDSPMSRNIADHGVTARGAGFDDTFGTSDDTTTTVTTVDDGTYEFTGLAPGLYEVTVDPTVEVPFYVFTGLFIFESTTPEWNPVTRTAALNMPAGATAVQDFQLTTLIANLPP
jgi:LPXTG-motif cell wall-anchored protein